MTELLTVLLTAAAVTAAAWAAAVATLGRLLLATRPRGRRHRGRPVPPLRERATRDDYTLTA